MHSIPERAAIAARSVHNLFARPLCGVRGTYLPASYFPANAKRSFTWNYWWQAHAIDALVDAGLREYAQGESPISIRRAEALLRTMKLRNFGKYVNDYYDDMAWLVLATARLDDAGQVTLGLPTGRHQAVIDVLDQQLRSAHTDHLRGGVWWHHKRDFKNVPATGPAAIHWARHGETDRAAGLVDWMTTHLFDTDTGLFLDGIRIEPDQPDGIRVIRDIYTYNQGTTLGAMLEVGRPGDITAAERLIAAVAEQLVEPATADAQVLITHGDGDGGLFTSILARYLTQAAHDDRLADNTRDQARRCVLDTAEAFWATKNIRRMNHPCGGQFDVAVFSQRPTEPATQTVPFTDPVEESSQVQAWTLLELAAIL